MCVLQFGASVRACGVRARRMFHRLRKCERRRLREERWVEGSPAMLIMVVCEGSMVRKGKAAR